MSHQIHRDFWVYPSPGKQCPKRMPQGVKIDFSLACFGFQKIRIDPLSVFVGVCPTSRVFFLSVNHNSLSSLIHHGL
jgi:hypothetical protein